MANTLLYWLHTLSPTHVGTGRGVGYINLPIHRDKVTNWPLIPGSSFKGVWADHYCATEENRKSDPELRAAFGRADENMGGSNAGALIPTDAHLVCLPVRSFYGTFAWCTSPLALEMLRRDLEFAGMAAADLPPQPPKFGDAEVRCTKKTRLTGDGRIFFEDLEFDGKTCDIATQWAERLADWIFPRAAAWSGLFQERFAIVPDTVFDFLTETGAEVTTRVRISDDTKTVVPGALWTEEALPAETILAGLIACDRVYSGTNGVTPEALIKRCAADELMLQIGGKASVGRGRVRCVFTPPVKDAVHE